jgi:enoyl-CoA hydratase/carnithine racemase
MNGLSASGEAPSEQAAPVLYDSENGVALLTLNRPHRLNAWTPQMGELYYELLRRATEDAGVRVIVVTGAGRGFCAGADIARLESVVDRVLNTDEEARRFPFRAFEIPKPVLAAVNGACAGVGLVWALEADVRFAARGAKLTTAFARRGLVAENGSAWLLTRLVGQANALDLLLSGRVVLAEEAQAMGLVNRVFEPSELLAETMRYANELASLSSPSAMAIIKRQVYRAAAGDFATDVKESLQYIAGRTKSSDYREGVASFIERRQPAFDPLDRPAIQDPFS